MVHEPPIRLSSPLSSMEMRELADANIAAWNAHDVPGVLAQLTEDVVFVDAGQPRELRGWDDVGVALRDTFTAFPDLAVLADSLTVLTDERRQLTMSSWVVEATMTGPLQGAPGTGRPLRISGATVARLRGDRICDYRQHYNSLSMMQQLGLLPASDQLGFRTGTAQVVAQRAKKELNR